ncbi:16S rRNA (cytosine(967)-C(5))-methyltransferase RsmB [Francisellaceae bacterium]|nr:16S rRNA (cytosine(967)-C(5))-methyltransferase RsmB [Francisellaceae bacterium]
MKNTRAISAQIIHNILQNKTSLIHLEQSLERHELTSEDKAFIQALCYGVCRYYFLLQEALKPHLKKQPKPLAQCLLLVGLYQLKFMDQPNYAVIHETVSACKALKIEWAKGFLNAILRKLAQSDIIQPEKYLAEIRYAFPNWLFQRVLKTYPENWRDILAASNQQPPMFIRVNESVVSTDAYTELLGEEGIQVNNTPIDSCLQLEKPMPVASLPNFDKGWCSVQDYSAQFAAHILAPLAKENVLDACAAPGGKTIALLEQNTDIQVTAIDNNPKRLDKIKENIARVFPETDRLSLICAEAQALDAWYENIPFDAILLDAPCSATGVIRRHPDIKLLRTEAEIEHIIEVQKTLLENLWKALKPNGFLLYVTCSILPEENHQQITHFLSTHPDAQEQPIETLNEHKNSNGPGYQLFPDLGDGFYYCLLQKQS